MGQSIRDVMSTDPVVLQQEASIQEAAQAMREQDIGDVIVLDDSQQICGIVTDRDIAVRAVAQGRDPQSVTVGEICSRDLQTLSPDDDVGDAVKVMSEKAIRRLPVVDNGRPVGIVSLGDLAVTRDPDSVLADISAAPADD
jgi:signal-transduction protein with cAMP-binding, CBS, and nucleotidyltransferase domain